MLKRNFDPTLRLRVLVYLRMSGDQQNKRSPDQQLAEIQRRLKALGYNWIVVKIYRDDAISGRLLRKRASYQEMVRDIKSETVAADAILVDTLERFGRVEELPTIRKMLFDRHGVLILTADNDFADPNTPQGKALGMFESMRATEEGRIKAHQVLRGKRDAARQNHWPGGPVPRGLMLQSVMKSVHGRQEVDYCILVPDPEAAWIIVLMFEKAAETGWGQTKLARFLTAHPDIPAKYKPFHPSTVGDRLDNRIYYGELVWEKNATGIVDDQRVIEPNLAEDVIRVPDFCEPLVSRELWERVQAVRQARREAAAKARSRNAEDDGKQIKAPAPGMTLKYLLTGLVRCWHCKRSMTPSAGGKYITEAGEERSYTAYVCPGYIAGICPNSKRVPEEWLREVVVAKIRERLFPWTE